MAPLIDGVRMLLLVGAPVPTPPPAALLEAWRSAEVTRALGEREGFQLRFEAHTANTREFDALMSGPISEKQRVVLAVLLGPVTHVLIDGVITHTQLDPQGEGAALTVTGRDLSVWMDLEERNGAHDNLSDSMIVEKTLKSYASRGLAGPHKVTPTTDVPVSTRRVPHQHETDLALVRRLGARNGMVFAIEPQAPGVSAAWWGPPLADGPPLPALTTAPPLFRNVRSLSFTNDALESAEPRGSALDPATGVVTPVTPPPSSQPPLSSQPSQPMRVTLDRDLAWRDQGTAGIAARAAAGANMPVRAHGEVTTAEYGAVLRPRAIVGVRGAGLGFGGNYMVKRVTHTLSRGEHTQRFELVREGVGALAPTVAP